MIHKYLFVICSLVICSSCTIGPSESSIQTAISQTQSAKPTLTPLPTKTPTLSPKQLYCSHMNEVYDEINDFRRTASDFVVFLKTESDVEVGYGTGYLTWGEWLDSLVSISSSMYYTSWRELARLGGTQREGYNKCLTLSKQLRDDGTNLQLSFNRVEPPQEVKMAHNEILYCFSDAADTGALVVDFLQNDVPFYAVPGFESCRLLDIYYEDIGAFCNQ